MASIDLKYTVAGITQVTTTKSSPRKRIIFTAVSGAPISLSQNSSPITGVDQGIILTGVGSNYIDEADLTLPKLYQGDWFANAVGGVLAVHEELE
jgi:hypothetical protein